MKFNDKILKINISLFVVFLLIVSLIFPQKIYGDIWNIAPNTYKFWINQNTSYTSYVLNETGDPVKSDYLDNGFLQYTSFSFTYSPTSQIHGSIFLPFEKKKDEIGRPIPDTLVNSFNDYNLPQVYFDLHYGLTDNLYTQGLGFFYYLPLEKIESKTHHAGISFSTYLNVKEIKMVFISSTALAASYGFFNEFSNDFLRGGYVLEKIEVYHDITSSFQGHYLFEGVASNWYYFKMALGAYIPLGTNRSKIGFHYNKIFFGKWVLPSDGIEISLDYYFTVL